MDFPLPEPPTIATRLPGVMLSERFSMMGSVSGPYPKVTSRSSRWPSRRVPSSVSSPVRSKQRAIGCRSTSWMRLASALRSCRRPPRLVSWVTGLLSAASRVWKEMRMPMLSTPSTTRSPPMSSIRPVFTVASRGGTTTSTAVGTPSRCCAETTLARKPAQRVKASGSAPWP